MMVQPTFQDVTYNDYPIQYPSSASTSVEELDEPELWDRLLSMWIRKKLPNVPVVQNLISLIEADWSSVLPHFDISNDTRLVKEVTSAILTQIPLEYDVFVRMPPAREYSLRVRVQCIQKAVPRVVEPEGYEL